MEGFMKNFVLAVFGLLIGLFISCASSAKIYRPLSEFPNAEVIGPIQTTFKAIYYNSFGVVVSQNETAYIALLEAAKRQYDGNIDVVDITVAATKVPPGPLAQFQESTFTANGKAVRLKAVNPDTVGLENALERAAEEVAENFPARASIAIVYIAAQDTSLTEYISGELEHLLRRRGCIIVDRSELDRVRAEQQFGMSGEVDDNTAASIGKIAGANIVITGRVDGEGNLRRLRLRALDTTSAQVVGTASERL
jgi:hypothetical protein